MPSNTNTNLSLCIVKKKTPKIYAGEKILFFYLFIVFFVKQLISASLMLANKGREDWYVVIVKHGRRFQVWKTKPLICRPPDDSKCVCKKIVAPIAVYGENGFLSWPLETFVFLSLWTQSLILGQTMFDIRIMFQNGGLSAVCSLAYDLWLTGCCSKCAVLHTDLPLLVTFHVKTLRWQLWKYSCWGLKCLKGRFTSDWVDQNWQFVFLDSIFSVSLCSSKQIFRH